jgi:hypothetical protein
MNWAQLLCVNSSNKFIYWKTKEKVLSITTTKKENNTQISKPRTQIQWEKNPSQKKNGEREREIPTERLSWSKGIAQV